MRLPNFILQFRIINLRQLIIVLRGRGWWLNSTEVRYILQGGVSGLALSFVDIGLTHKSNGLTTPTVCQILHKQRQIWQNGHSILTVCHKISAVYLQYVVVNRKCFCRISADSFCRNLSAESRKNVPHFCLSADCNTFLQKVTVSAERISAEIRIFEEALFLLSAEMEKFSFGWPLTQTNSI